MKGDQGSHSRGITSLLIREDLFKPFPLDANSKGPLMGTGVCEWGGINTRGGEG